MLTDFAHLVPAAQKGNKKAIETICLTFRPLVISLAQRKRYSILLQDTENLAYCVIIQLINTYKGTVYQCFPGYIKKMLIFALNNAAKKQQRITYYEMQNMEDIEISTPIVNNEDEEHRIKILMLKQAIKKLPLNYRQLLKNYYWENKTDKEIGNRLQISQQAVSKMRKKVLKELRSSM